MCDANVEYVYPFETVKMTWDLPCKRVKINFKTKIVLAEYINGVQYALKHG